MTSVERFVYHLALQIQDDCKRRRQTQHDLVSSVKKLLQENYAKIEVISTQYREPRNDVLEFRQGIMISFSIQLDTRHIFTIYLIRDAATDRYKLAERTRTWLTRLGAGMTASM